MYEDKIHNRRSKKIEKLEEEYVFLQEPEDNRKSKKSHKPYSPAFDFKIFMLFFSIRCASAIYNLIWDCDETYNYWEPLHFFLYGSGLQTWEYSPEFSLRSYLYTLVNAAPIWPIKLISPHQKIIHFYSLRLVFALISSLFEMKAYTALRRFSPSVAFYYLAFSLTNVGMFLSSTSFLPSTFAMHLITYAYAKWLVDDCKKAIFAIGCAILLGWPFVAVFGLPIVVDYLFFKKRGLFNLISIIIVFGGFISIPIILVDSYLYGKFVFPPLNIFIYNVFSAKGGPELYGKEPFSYYVKNCILNFNVLYPIGLITGLILIYDYFRSNNRYFFRHFFLIWSTMMVWLAIFMTRPHKEERFLYPIYPLLLISASASVSLIVKHFKLFGLTNILVKLTILVHFLVSLARLLALLKSYSAAMDIYVHLNEPAVKYKSVHLENTELLNVCVGKEWYRFPSSFFIPEKLDSPIKHQEWQLRFVKADFGGQLPGYFNQKLSLPMSTRYVDSLFNDENKMVKERFLDMKKCHFWIDSDSEEGEIKNIEETRWKCLNRIRFLDSTAEFSGTNNLFKSFYVPFLFEKNVKFTYFKLYQRLN